MLRNNAIQARMTRIQFRFNFREDAYSMNSGPNKSLNLNEANLPTFSGESGCCRRAERVSPHSAASTPPFRETMLNIGLAPVELIVHRRCFMRVGIVSHHLERIYVSNFCNFMYCSMVHSYLYLFCTRSMGLFDCWRIVVPHRHLARLLPLV